MRKNQLRLCFLTWLMFRYPRVGETFDLSTLSGVPEEKYPSMVRLAPRYYLPKSLRAYFPLGFLLTFTLQML